MNFIDEMKNNEKSYTENGALGYKTSGQSIVDLNFKIPSYRTKIDIDKSLGENTNLTLRWLLYLRDIKEGVGERKSFREYLLYYCQEHEELALKFLDIVDITEYGRWDDIVWLYCQDNISYREKCTLAHIIRDQVEQDKQNYLLDKPISLLAKWLPSENASSKETKENAKKIRIILRLNSREYRKLLSSLRKYIDIVERKISKNEWDSVNYSKVPSKANLLYAQAFLRHDGKRREEYLDKVEQGKEKINANALFLHDIIHKYKNQNPLYVYGNSSTFNKDETLELLWKAQKKIEGFSNTLVVRDGSASMCSCIGNSEVTALDVADAITLYCAENNSGIYKKKFLTFSHKAKVVDVSNCLTLADKLSRIIKEDDYSNTDINNVFNLVLNTALKTEAKQEDLPKTILIISDMEFDYISNNEEILFEEIGRKFEENGYKLPKLVFWNVNSRNNVIPIQQNENGVILLSGFSKNLMEMVMSSELDPYNALVKVLNKKRYEVIDKIA